MKKSLAFAVFAGGTTLKLPLSHEDMEAGNI